MIKQLFSTIWSKLNPGTSEQSNQKSLSANHQPYQNAYFFTHVPKTGGTSFIVFLDRFFPAKVIFPHQLWLEVGDFGAIDKDAYHLVRGHFGGGAIDLITNKEVKFLTILRDPVKLAYSTYEFVKRETGTALHPLVAKENMSFETFLEHPKTKHLVTNRMVHNLVYGYKHDETLSRIVLDDTTFAEFRKGMNKGQADLHNTDRLNMSRQFLADCLWFGILEDFTHAVRLLCYKMAWPPLGQSQKLNTNKNPVVISDEAREKAIALNQLDYPLYQFALERFNQEVAAMYDDLGCNKDDDDAFIDGLIDAHYKRNYREKYQLDLLSNVDYKFAEILLGNQWHRREWDAYNQRYFRWSGPGSSCWIDFWLKPAEYNITIQVVDAVDSSLFKTLKLALNGQQVEWSSDGLGKKRTLQLSCPKSVLKDNGLLRLTFSGIKTQQHKSLFASDDSRLVGIAVESIKITAQ